VKNLTAIGIRLIAVLALVAMAAILVMINDASSAVATPRRAGGLVSRDLPDDSWRHLREVRARLYGASSASSRDRLLAHFVPQIVAA